MKICVPIVGPTIEQAEEQLTRAAAVADMVELRFDLLEPVTPSKVNKWQKYVSLPMIFKDASPELVALGPAYVDSEHPIPVPTGTQLIVSRHDDSQPFTDFPPADFHKHAVPTRSTLDGLRMAVAPGRIGIAMGEDGLVSRFFGPWTYAALSPELATAPGQLTVEQARDIYRVRRITPETPLYGLIGDPVAHSPGHFIHNALLDDGVYVKMRLRPEELEEAFSLFRQLNLGGLSVTMPLKEAVIPYLDRVTCSAVNTICVEDGEFVGYNTDGPAVMKLLRPEPGSHVVIIGAGGAARGVAESLAAERMRLTILNRSLSRAQKLADDVGGEAGLLCNPLPICDSVVQTTPLGMMWETQGKSRIVDMAMGQRGGMRVWLAQAELQQQLWSRARVAL